MTCSDCKHDKPEIDFSKDRATKSGLRSYCRDCASVRYKRDYSLRADYHKARSSKWAKENPERRKLIQKNADLKSLYGLSLERFEILLTKQGGLCCICCLPMKKPCVDHCHETGTVRGLLCTACNTGIGHLKHSPELLRSALGYLSGGINSHGEKDVESGFNERNVGGQSAGPNHP